MFKIEKILKWMLQSFINCDSIIGGLLGFIILILLLSIYSNKKEEWEAIQNQSKNWWEN